jgi:cell division protein FtsL
LNRSYQKENISALFEQMDKKIEAVPKVIPVRHHHHFDQNSKWILISFFSLVLAVSVLSGTSIGFAAKSYLLKQEVADMKARINNHSGDTISSKSKTMPLKSTTRKKPRIRKPGHIITKLSIQICNTMNKSLNLNEFAEQGTLSVFVNSRQEPVGILIPLKQWPKIAPSVNKNCELHQLMEQLTYKPIFECSLKELEERLRPEIEKVEAEHLNAGQYNIYQYTGDGKSPNMFVRQYTDRKELVRTDNRTGQSHIVNRNF